MKIIIKKYDDASRLASFSLSKSIISGLIGICIDEGKIKSVNDPITDYLPQLKGKGFDNERIVNLLKHTSGINYNKKALKSTFDDLEIYRTKNLRPFAEKSQVKTNPDNFYNYKNENFLLLGLIIEQVTGKSLSAFFEEKIWSQIGTTTDAHWVLDNNSPQAMEKAFCCIGATARDFAKIGRLYLNNGNWNGQQLISQKWIETSTQYDPKTGGLHGFQYNWMSFPKGYNGYYGVGLYGQFICIFPEKHTIIVRFGESDINYGSPFWKVFMMQVMDQI